MNSLSPFVTSPWKIVVAVFPGLLLVLQNFDFWWVFPFSAPIWLMPASVIAFTGLVLALNASQNRKVEPWAFPAIGASVWGLWILVLIWQPRILIWIFDTIVAFFSIVGLVILYKLKWIITKPVWVQFLIITLGVSTLEIFRTSDLDIQATIFIEISLWITYLIPILSFGLLLGRHYNMGTMLFVVTLEPFLFERYLGQNLSYAAWTSTFPAVQVAKAIFHVVPYLIFLLVLPLIVLTWQSFKSKTLVTNIISIITICAVVAARVYFLSGPSTSNSFSLVPWAMWLQFVIVLYSPILLATSISKNCLPWPGQET
ncbi:MAG: hypothetical protein ACOYZ8_11985 [Chloroflexota bacterium]